MNQQASVYGKRFGNVGGVSAAVLSAMQEAGTDTSNITVEVCDGADECKKALLMLKAGKLPADFIEGMACIGGCVGGPSRHTDINQAKRARDILISQADDRSIEDNIHACNLEHIPMTKNK
ncbi:MAG: [Fe-Fe] hydrogenase large subunit C-terminal domain-containing protein [Lachnospiraceae bacterium]|nr:[Fe-Fe] hydrogenase large subunit C-terminal domain-containing protein [Lachnospiraceae bacterium]